MTDILCNVKLQLTNFLEEVKKYPCYPKINEHMADAIKEIGYSFKDTSFLMLAFCRVKLENGKKDNYKNDTLAQVGDAILDLVIVERGFSKGKDKGTIDKDRQEKGGNKVLYKITEDKDLKRFCYHKNDFFNDVSNEENKVSAGNHDSIVEAIIGAIYFDGGLDKAREWIISNIFNKHIV